MHSTKSFSRLFKALKWTNKNVNYHKSEWIKIKNAHTIYNKIEFITREYWRNTSNAFEEIRFFIPYYLKWFVYNPILKK